MPSMALARAAKGLGRGARGFGGALMDIVDTRESRRRWEQEQALDEMLARAELAATQGVTVGEHPTRPMPEGPSSPAPDSGGSPFRRTDRTFLQAGEETMPVSRGFSGELSRIIGQSERPEVKVPEAARLGTIDGQPVYFDPTSTEQAIDNRRFARTVKELVAAGVEPSRAPVLARDKVAVRDILGPGEGAALDSTYHSLGRDYKDFDQLLADRREWAEAGNPTAGDETGEDKPTFAQMRDLIGDQLYRKTRTKAGVTERVPVAPLTPEREMNVARIGTRDPAAAQDSIAKIYEEAYGPAPAPADSGAAPAPGNVVEGGGGEGSNYIPDWMESAGRGVGRFARSAWGEVLGVLPGQDRQPAMAEDSARVSPGDSAVPDSVAARSVAEAYGNDPDTQDERRERMKQMRVQGDSADAAPDSLYGVPRSKLRMAIKKAGSIDAAISRLEQIEDRNEAEEQALEALRRLNSSGYPR